MSLADFSPKKRMTDLNSTEFSTAMGEKLRILRVIHNLSQQEMGDRIGVTYAQIQKYENGKNSIGLFRLLRLCKAFGLDWSHFLDALPETSDPVAFAPKNRTTIEMLEAFEAISNGSHRRTLINLAQALADKQ